ncbi:hypothetical protein FRC02_005170 [Tulasnella sp. 418]|nr:hypothetical protein FRC02_005170 [Tulasnella sp. 418]
MKFIGVGFMIEDLWAFLKGRCQSVGAPSRAMRVEVYENGYYRDPEEVPADIKAQIVTLIGRDNFRWEYLGYGSRQSTDTP